MSIRQVDDSTWRAVAPVSGLVRRLGVSAVVLVLAAAALWWTGAFWPRLTLRVVSTTAGPASGTATLQVEVVNEGLFAATLQSASTAPGGPHIAVHPFVPATTQEEDYPPFEHVTLGSRAVDGNGTQRITLVLRACEPVRHPWTVQLIAYGPTGGDDVDYVLGSTPDLQRTTLRLVCGS